LIPEQRDHVSRSAELSRVCVTRDLFSMSSDAPATLVSSALGSRFTQRGWERFDLHLWSAHADDTSEQQNLAAGKVQGEHCRAEKIEAEQSVNASDGWKSVSQDRPAEAVLTQS
jgi:hypothetical protein